MERLRRHSSELMRRHRGYTSQDTGINRYQPDIHLGLHALAPLHAGAMYRRVIDLLHERQDVVGLFLDRQPEGAQQGQSPLCINDVGIGRLGDEIPC
jgi:hypothetical protein